MIGDNPKYYYSATVVSIYDGDTITLNVDLGFGIWSVQKFRLFGIDTPEIRGPERPEGIKARDYVRERIPIGSEILIKTDKDRKGKYGRYLVTIFANTPPVGNLNTQLVELGYAEVYEP